MWSFVRLVSLTTGTVKDLIRYRETTAGKFTFILKIFVFVF